MESTPFVFPSDFLRRACTFKETPSTEAKLHVDISTLMPRMMDRVLRLDSLYVFPVGYFYFICIGG